MGIVNILFSDTICRPQNNRAKERDEQNHETFIKAA